MIVRSNMHIIISDIEDDPEGLEWVEIRLGGQVDTTDGDTVVYDRTINARYADNRWGIFLLEEDSDDMDPEALRIIEDLLPSVTEHLNGKV